MNAYRVYLSDRSKNQREVHIIAQSTQEAVDKARADDKDSLVFMVYQAVHDYINRWPAASFALAVLQKSRCSSSPVPQLVIHPRATEQNDGCCCEISGRKL